MGFLEDLRKGRDRTAKGLKDQRDRIESGEADNQVSSSIKWQVGIVIALVIVTVFALALPKFLGGPTADCGSDASLLDPRECAETYADQVTSGPEERSAAFAGCYDGVIFDRFKEDEFADLWPDPDLLAVAREGFYACKEAQYGTD